MILIPAYNEAATIGNIIKTVSAYAPVVVVSDGSTDDTVVIARQAGAHVVVHPYNCGYNQTILRGFQEIRALGGEYVITLDADGEHDPSTVTQFIDALKIYPLVLGFREKPARIAESIMVKYWQHRLGINDILCGMRGYNLAKCERYLKPDAMDFISAKLALKAIKDDIPFTQCEVFGQNRADVPRYGSVLKANMKIFAGFMQSVLWDSGKLN